MVCETYRWARGAATTALVACALLVAGAGEAAAQPVGAGVVGARIGGKRAVAGLSVQPGLVRQPGAAASRTGGALATVGLVHVVSETFMMGGELGLGMQWLDEHPMSRTGEAESERALAWQLSLLGRWVPGGALEGPSLGGGVQLYRAVLSDVSVQLMAVEARAGWLLWQGDEGFAMIELGYALPVIGGLSLPGDYSTEGDDPTPAQDWTWHRLSLGVLFSF